MDFKEIDEKYPVEEISSQSEMIDDGDESKLDEYCQDIDMAANAVSDIETAVSESLDSKELNKVIFRARETISMLNNKYKIESLNTIDITSESLVRYPRVSLTYHKEDLLDVIKTIMFKLKEFLLYIGRQVVAILKRIYQGALDVYGDSKKLYDKLETNVKSNIKLNESYSQLVVDFLTNKYSNIPFLGSYQISSKPSLKGLGEIILDMINQDLDLNIPEIQELQIGDYDKYSENVLNYYKDDTGVSRKFFKNRNIVDSNIIEVANFGETTRDYFVNIYNVDVKYIYFIAISKDESGELRFKVDKTQPRNFRYPRIMPLRLEPGDVNEILLNNPVGFARRLLETNITVCKNSSRLITKIPGHIKLIENTLEFNFNQFNGKFEQGELGRSLRSYSRLVKEMARNYYTDISNSRLRMHIFYYKFANIIYNGLIGSQEQ